MVVPLGEDTSRRPVAWMAAAGVLAVIAAELAFIHFREAPPQQRSVRFQVPLPEKLTAESLRLSPDGRYLAIAAGGRLWVRSLDSLETKALPGAERTPAGEHG